MLGVSIEREVVVILRLTFMQPTSFFKRIFIRPGGYKALILAGLFVCMHSLKTMLLSRF